MGEPDLPGHLLNVHLEVWKRVAAHVKGPTDQHGTPTYLGADTLDSDELQG